jgi:hypothetical protein
MRQLYFIFLLMLFLALSCKKETTEPNKDEMPIINNISILKYASGQTSVFRGDIGIELECDAYDNDGFIADYLWEATGGTIRGAANHARWDAPTGVPGIYYVVCTVKDNDNNIAREDFAIDVLNRIPKILKIEIYPGDFGVHNPNIMQGSSVQFITFVDNPEQDIIEFKYIMPDTTTDWMWQILFYTVPYNLPDTNKVYVTVKDEYGATDSDSLEFYIY